MLCKRTSFSSLMHKLYWNGRNNFEFNSTNLRSSKPFESVHMLIYVPINEKTKYNTSNVKKHRAFRRGCLNY